MAAGKNKKTEPYGPASAFRFDVLIGKQNQKICFSKVSGLERTVEYEEIHEGGYNMSPHLVAVPHKRHAPLILERGVVSAENWVSQMRPGMWLGTWLMVVLLDSQGKWLGRYFTIKDGLITKWEISGMNAMSSEILVEKLEIMHEGIECTFTRPSWAK